MIYKYDKENLTYKSVTKNLVLGVIGVVVLFTAITSVFMLNKVNDIRYISSETKSIIIKESAKENEFSPKKLRAYILELNIKFPHIVYAQARLETGNFKSQIFKTNHNLFGMKVATLRPTTNKGEENGHAYYEGWRESVVDYAFYQAQYLSDIKTEAEYLQYLKANYAEAPNYMEQLQIILAEKDFKK
jgi:phage antirepressor YoqD-like protein